MLMFTIVFALLAVLVLIARKPDRPPQESREYRIDHRVVASILVLMALGFAILAWTSGKYF